MTLEEIKHIIESAIPDSTAHVLDPMNDGEHLQAIVVSNSFDGLMLVKQHQMVMKPLKEAFASTVHALALKTLTPQQFKEQRNQLGL